MRMRRLSAAAGMEKAMLSSMRFSTASSSASGRFVASTSMKSLLCSPV